MKNIIERIAGGAKIARYLPKAVSTRLAVAALAALAAGGAWAAVPTVVWDGDFDTTTKTGADGVEYTFTVNPLGNSGENLNTLSGGNLVIGSGSTYGGQISWNYNSSETYTSVLIKYSNFTATDNKVLASVSAETTTGGNAGQVVDDCVSVLSAANSTLTGRFNNNSSTWPNNGNSVATSSESGYMLIVYGSGQAFQFYTSSDGVTWNGGTATGLSFANTFACGVGLGGMSGLGKDVNGTANNGYGVSSGMTIQGVAIFRGVALTTNLVRPPSSFDSEYTDSNNKKWKYANATFTWKSSSGTDIGSSTGTSVSLFSLPSDADTSVSFACGGNTTWTGSNFWEGFCLGRGTYSAPGYAFRVTSSHSNKSITAGFSPLTLGGLIIESGASGVNFPDSSRATILGAASGDDETWFGIYDNATISRGGFLKFSGNVNLEIAKGKTFTVVASSIVKTVTDANGTSTDGGIFRMHGLGTITVPTLTATGGATLDYSDVQEDADVVRSTTPFIQGNLTIDSTTKFVFPAGLAKNTAYKLCSGTLTAPASVICDITVGTTVKKNVPLTFSGNTVSYGDPVYAATVDGTTVTWDGDEPESYDGIVMTFSGTGTVTGLSGAGTTINAAAGVTVDVTDFTSPMLLGAGTFRWTANYPTTVPTGDFSYEYVGTTSQFGTQIDNVTVSGYLKTSGNIALASFTLNNGGTLEVESGVTAVQAKQRLALSGNITIDSGAIFSNLQTADGHNADAVNYDQQGMKIIVRGTLAMSNTRWSLRQKSYHEFKLYDGAQITGTGDGNGALDWIESCGGQLDTYGGTVTISANMKVRSGATTANWVASGATCKFTGSTWGDGGFSKSGAGTLSFEGTHTQTGGVSASDGTIALNNISMTSSTITLSSASASPTLKMIATDAATTVSATVNVPANTRGQLAFEGAGTFALSGPNRNNNIVWLGTNLAEGTLNLAGDVTINNGSRGGSYVFNKVIGSGTLTLSTWEGCFNSNDNGLTYTINTIDADSFAGAIALKNVAAPNRQDGNNDCTLKFAIGDIKKSSAVYGTAIVGLTTNITAGAHGVNSIDVDLSSTTFNNSPATFLYDGSTGVYLAEASYNGTPYKTLALAIAAMETAEGNPADVIVYNSAATIPSGYGLVTPASGNMTLRRAGEIYYTSGYWSSTENSFAVVTANGAATSAAAGDTVVIDSTHTSLSEAWVADTFPVNVSSVRVAKNFTLHSGVLNAILGGIAIAVEDGFMLSLDNSGSQKTITLGSAAFNGPGSVLINASIPVSGSVTGTAVLNVSSGKTLTVASTGSVANSITLASGATLVVESGGASTIPTTEVVGAYVKETSSGSTTTYTVATQPTVSDVAFEYGADYASATVTATVSDTTLDYYISWAGGEPVRGSISGSGSQVTFDVSGINHTTEYQSAGYTITAKDGETDVQTTGGSGTSVAADTTPWFSHNSSGLTGGAWTTPVDLTEPATVADNKFTATAESTSSRVVLEFNVCFSATNDANVDGDAQAAIKLGEVDSATTFMVLTNANEWAAISNAALTPNASETNKVVLTIDYGSNTYGVTVNGHVMKDAANSESFPLAASKTSVQTIDFAGSGTLKSMKGDQVEGYMVKDNAGNWYATIQAAIQAYNSANGPYTVLHDGTAPSGWKIDETTKALIKLAKGFFFMAY